MVTPDPRRGDGPDPDDRDLPQINGSAPQHDDEPQASKDAGPRGQYGPTADYGDDAGEGDGEG